ncbi:AraC family transcriptional regulator [Paenibacillus flagellatus]|nr:AraC family transcriptional regulator [Paenibacillus flagellatus]
MKNNERTTSDPAAGLGELAALIERHAPTDGSHETAVPALRFIRATDTYGTVHSVYTPSLCIIAQGAKTASLADERYRYDPASYLVTSVHLPIAGRVVRASPEEPYLGLHLGFGTDDILDLAEEFDPASYGGTEVERGIGIDTLTPELLDAVVRLVRLLDSPQDVPVLAPLVIRETLYRVMQGKLRRMMLTFAAAGSHSHRIAGAIRLIRRDFDKPLRIERLAKEVHMSASALHKHFKKATAMSPLQYQKAIRLQEARRLLLAESLEAADAAFRVGYESPTQFSREYARMFGLPPISDVQSVRGALLASERR